MILFLGVIGIMMVLGSSEDKLSGILRVILMLFVIYALGILN